MAQTFDKLHVAYYTDTAIIFLYVSIFSYVVKTSINTVHGIVMRTTPKTKETGRPGLLLR